MNPASWALLAVTGAVALADWFAVLTERKRLEYVAKPATMLALIGVALTLNAQSPDQQRLFIVALVLGAVGDVFLMLPRNVFLAGLGAFLVGHLAYLAGFLVPGEDLVRVAIFTVVLLVPGSLLLPRVVRGILSQRRPGLLPAVLAYSASISVMVGAALGSGRLLAAIGGLLFFASDTMIGYSRFVFQRRWLPIAIIVTYHVGQVGLILSMARWG